MSIESTRHRDRSVRQRGSRCASQAPDDVRTFLQPHIANFSTITLFELLDNYIIEAFLLPHSANFCTIALSKLLDNYIIKTFDNHITRTFVRLHYANFWITI
jgi:hypothetical protein